jgi:hypothetical protein
VAVQNAVSKREIAVGTASMQFFRNIGATVALPIFGVIVNLTINMDINMASKVPANLMNLAVHNVYLTGLVISIMGLVSCLFLKDAVLSNRMDGKTPSKELKNSNDDNMELGEKAK